MSYFESGDWLGQRPAKVIGQPSSQAGDSFLTRDNWGTWDSQPTQYALVPVQNPDDGVDFFDAAGRIIAAKYLTKPGKHGEPSFVDRQQEKLVHQLNRSMSLFGAMTEPVVNPFPANFNPLIGTIAQQYIDLLPSDAFTPTQFDTQADLDTRLLAERLKSGKLDKDYDITDDERLIAHEINTLIGAYPAAKLAEILKTHVFGRANDIVALRHANRFTHLQQSLANGMEKLNRIQPDRWFAVDWLTNYLLFTPEERKDLQNTIWTITPTQVHVKSISRLAEDAIRYPLTNFSPHGGSDDRIYVQDGTMNYVDRLRSIGIPQLQPAINTWARTGIGGLVVFRSLRRDEEVARFGVRNSAATSDAINKLGEVAGSYKWTLDRMTESLRNPEGAYKYPIRPNMILGLLPDPLVTEIDFRIRNNEIDWASGLPQIAQVKQDLKAQLTAAALRAATNIRPDGTVPKTMQAPVDEVSKQITTWSGAEERIKGKISPPAKKSRSRRSQD